MSFLYPAFLLGALAIALPVALHLLRRDVAPEVPFSAVRLVRRSPIDRTRRRRLRDLLLLAARVSALALLALAFARPYLTTASSPPGLRIIAIDRSFSMSAPGRFTHALDLAAAAIKEAEADAPGRIAVIAFDDRADVIAPPGSSGDARASLEGLAPRFGGTRFAPAIAKAIELAGRNPAHVVVISDLQRRGWEDEQPLALPAALQVDVRDAGVPPPNAAVVQVRVEPERVVAAISNSSGDAFTGTARVLVGGREVASAAVRVAPDDAVDVAVPYRAPGRGSLAVSIDDSKGFAADNARYVVLDPPLRTRVLEIATAGMPLSGLYFARALEAAEDHAFDLRTVSGAEASAMSPEEISRYAAIVLLSTRGLDRRGRDLVAGFVRGGGGLLIAGGADVEPAALVAALGWTRLASVKEVDAAGLVLAASDVRHPVFREFGSFAANLGQIRFERIWKLEADGWDVAARFTDGSAALIERPEGKGRAMIFASDVDRQWNEFPLHPAFVPFAAESVRHVAGARDRGRASVRDYVVADAPIGAKPVPGVYTVADGRTVAVNVDPRESTGDRLSAGEFSNMLTRPAGAEGLSAGQAAVRAQHVEAGQNLWQYGLLLMLGVLIVESAVART